jgi:hypothetical protein
MTVLTGGRYASASRVILRFEDLKNGYGTYVAPGTGF